MLGDTEHRFYGARPIKLLVDLIDVPKTHLCMVRRKPKPLFALSLSQFGLRALNDETGRMHDEIDDLEIDRQGLTPLAMIHRKGAEDRSLRRSNGDGPAGAQIMHQRNVAMILPQRVSRNVSDEDRRVAMNGATA